MVGPLDVAAALTRATSDLSGPQDLAATLETIITVALQSMPEIDHIGITVTRRDGRVQTLTRTDEIVDELERLQYDAGEGPCLQAMHSGATVTVSDARHEQRWPKFIPGATGLGLRSQMGVRLNVAPHTVGALNLYSFSADRVSEETEQLAELFAAHISLALGHAERLENLNAALASRKLIGLALGILMERLDIDEDRAFAYLTRISATTETKLRDVAASVVDEVHARQGDAEPGSSSQRPHTPPHQPA